MKPTEDQLESRKQLTDFLDRVAKPAKRLAGQIKSEWFGRPDKELEGYIQLGSALKEIEDTRGYKMIMAQTEREVLWAQQQLEVCDEAEVTELRMYLRSLRFLKAFVLTVERNSDISATVLAGRPAAIGKDMFVRNARVEGD
jgi:hypothetical protein